MNPLVGKLYLSLHRVNTVFGNSENTTFPLATCSLSGVTVIVVDNELQVRFHEIKLWMTVFVCGLFFFAQVCPPLWHHIVGAGGSFKSAISSLLEEITHVGAKKKKRKRERKKKAQPAVWREENLRSVNVRLTTVFVSVKHV